MKTCVTVDDFIAKFEAIPEEMWITDSFRSPDGARCALGHCGADMICDPAGVITTTTPESLALNELFRIHIGVLAEHVNDKRDGFKRYLQPTPKQRILAALRDIKAKQEAEKPKPEFVQVPVPLMLMDKLSNAAAVGMSAGAVIVCIIAIVAGVV